METRLPSICVECGLCCDGTLYSDVVFGRDGNDPSIQKERKRFKTLEFKAAHHDKEPAWRAPLHPCEFLGSDNILRKSSCVRLSNSTLIGSLPCNSGIKSEGLDK